MPKSKAAVAIAERLVQKSENMSKAQAEELLSQIDTVEKATALSGPEKEKYLNALDTVYGERSKRAKDLGFSDDTYYHGSFRNIKEFKPEKGSAEGHLGKSTYLTNDPADASYNYAHPEGQDVENKIERLTELYQNQKDLNYTAAKELAVKKVVGRVDSGAVYPLRVRADNTADLTHDSNQWLDLNHKYDDDGNITEENPLVQNIVDRISKHSDKPHDLYEDVKPQRPC